MNGQTEDEYEKQIIAIWCLNINYEVLKKAILRSLLYNNINNNNNNNGYNLYSAFPNILCAKSFDIHYNAFRKRIIFDTISTS